MSSTNVRAVSLALGALLAACSSGPGSSGGTGGGPGAASGWTATSPSSLAGATLADAVPYGSGFVAVGAGPDVGSTQAGGIWVSVDGTTWNLVTADLSATHLKAVTVTGKGLVAAGEHCTGECIGYRLWSSPDGQAWSGPSEPSGSDDFVAVGVAAREQTLVAVGGKIVDLAGGNGEDGRVMTSSDGKTWTVGPDIPAMHSVRLGGIGSGPDAFVVVGSVDSGSTRTGAAWTSADGAAWTRASDDPSFAGALLTSVAVGGPGFVAAGSIGPNGAVWTSIDGKSWTHVDDAKAFAGRQLVDIAATPGGLVVVGNDATGGHAWTSTDATTWHDAGQLPGADAAKFVAVTIGTKSTMIGGKPLPGVTPAGLVWLGPLPG
ncbi:MAG TPA: hypothetical protein VL749_11730 [Patescibacteria group bacterium]|jgi:hypothetical protein|nr:hypothetical protein [Patescibacteria group bacterium]